MISKPYFTFFCRDFKSYYVFVPCYELKVTLVYISVFFYIYSIYILYIYSKHIDIVYVFIVS